MTRADPRTCVGCLGTRSCWICEGTGSTIGSAPRSVSGGCRRCAGTGVCSLCPPDVPAPRTAPEPERDG